MAAITTVEDVCWLTQTAGAAEVKSSAEAAARRPRGTEAEARAWLDAPSPPPPEPEYAHGSGPVNGDLVAALLDVRRELEAEQKLSVLHYPNRIAVACSRCGRELPDGNGVSSHGVGGLYCGERCISAQEASIPLPRDTMPSHK